MVAAIERAGGTAAYRRGLWQKIAFCARYGHQPISELKRMYIEDLDRFGDALAELIGEESPTTHMQD